MSSKAISIFLLEVIARKKICVETTFSKTLDREGSFKVFLTIVQIRGSRLGVFKRGLTEV